jgi:hypothetical protein
MIAIRRLQAPNKKAASDRRLTALGLVGGFDE